MHLQNVFAAQWSTGSGKQSWSQAIANNSVALFIHFNAVDAGLIAC